MAATPKPEEMKALLKQNADKLAVAVVLVLTAVMAYMILTEKSAEVVAPTPTMKDVADTVKENPNYVILQQALDTTSGTIADYPRIEQLLRYNMFDPKTVKEKEAIEAQAREKLAQAKTAKEQGRNDEARRLLGEVMQVFPGNQEARDLLKELDSPASPAATPAPDAGVAPAPTPVV